MEKIQNVVIVNDFNYIQGGASKVAIDTANLLKDYYPNLNVYFFSGDSKKETLLNNNIINVSTKQGECLKNSKKLIGIKNGLYNKLSKNKLKELLLKLDPENTIIHVHGWTKCLSSSVFDMANDMNFKLVLTMHDYFTACPNGGYFNYRKNEICHLNPMSWKCIKCNCDSRNYFFKIYRIFRQHYYNKSFKNLKNVIAISDFSLNILKKTLPKNINIFRINNPINYNLNESKIDFNRNSYYLYVGRISREKGVDLFCKAITELNLPGIVVGEGNQKKLLEHNYPNIKFVGWKSETEVKNYMRDARCLIMPSRWYECSPLTNLEALSIGLPSLVNADCAASEASNKKNLNGDTFKLNIDDMKNTIQKFNLKNVDSSILNNYSCQYYVNSLFDTYKKIK